MFLFDWFSGLLIFLINCMYGEDWYRLKIKNWEVKVKFFKM